MSAVGNEGLNLSLLRSFEPFCGYVLLGREMPDLMNLRLIFESSLLEFRSN